jgi:hypothetical protein
MIIFSSGIDNFPCSVNRGGYPEACVDINLSSDDEVVHPSMPDAPTDQKMPAGDDGSDEGAT